MPELLRVIMGDMLDGIPGLVIAGRSAPNEDSLRKARDDDADLLIMQEQAQSGVTCLDLVMARSPLAIFALSQDGRSAASVILRRRGIEVESGGRSTIVEAIQELVERVGSDADEAMEPSDSKPHV